MVERRIIKLAKVGIESQIQKAKATHFIEGSLGTLNTLKNLREDLMNLENGNMEEKDKILKAYYGAIVLRKEAEYNHFVRTNKTNLKKLDAAIKLEKRLCKMWVEVSTDSI